LQNKVQRKLENADSNPGNDCLSPSMALGTRQPSEPNISTGNEEISEFRPHSLAVFVRSSLRLASDQTPGELVGRYRYLPI